MEQHLCCILEDYQDLTRATSAIIGMSPGKLTISCERVCFALVRNAQHYIMLQGAACNLTATTT